MTETPRTTDAAMAEELARLAARVDALDQRLAAMSRGPETATGTGGERFAQITAEVRDRARAVWSALTASREPAAAAAPGSAGDTAAAATARSPLATAALVVLALLAVLLALEVADEVFDALRHLLHRVF